MEDEWEVQSINEDRSQILHRRSVTRNAAKGQALFTTTTVLKKTVRGTGVARQKIRVLSEDVDMLNYSEINTNDVPQENFRHGYLEVSSSLRNLTDSDGLFRSSNTGKNVSRA